MTCYARCAYPCCSTIIPYELYDDVRSRYCEHHVFAMEERLEKTRACTEIEISNALTVKVTGGKDYVQHSLF
jgi:hypothetical protein